MTDSAARRTPRHSSPPPSRRVSPSSRPERIAEGREDLPNADAPFAYARDRESGTLPVSHDIGTSPLPRTRPVLVAAPLRDTKVTLCVTGWRNVQPGRLSWVFPTVDSAVHAAQAMRNAAEWVVLDGSLTSADIDGGQAARRRVLAKSS